jgi:hypothetical protein
MGKGGGYVSWICDVNLGSWAVFHVGIVTGTFGGGRDRSVLRDLNGLCGTCDVGINVYLIIFVT